MKLNVLSGKGGVGKSSIAASLASLISRKKPVVIVDCDVDTPSLGLFFGLHAKDFKRSPVSTGERASLVPSKCTKCKKCVDVCVFSAVEWDNGPVFNRFLCEGCGACQLVCPSNAIELHSVQNGWIGTAKTKNFTFVGGQLKPGESGSGDIVTLLKEEADKIAGKKDMLIDSAAGIGCPVIASVQGSDFIVAVTEPTPTALADLKRALAVVEHFKIPYGIVVNKFDLDEKFVPKIKAFAKKKRAPVLGMLPYDDAFINAIVRLKPVVEYDERFEPLFKEILENVLNTV